MEDRVRATFDLAQISKDILAKGAPFNLSTSPNPNYGYLSREPTNSITARL
jgi:hypothetical protein